MNELLTIHVAGTPTVIGGLKVRALSREPLALQAGEVATTLQATDEQYREALVHLNSGEAAYL